MKLTELQKNEIASAYRDHLIPVKKLADDYLVSRQAVYAILKSFGIDTRKGMIEVSCSFCGKSVLRHKCRLRKVDNVFCDNACKGRFKRKTRGTKEAVDALSDYVRLRDNHVIHYRDGNIHNNDLDNLIVFANQGDYIFYNRGKSVAPVFDGSNV